MLNQSARTTLPTEPNTVIEDRSALTSQPGDRRTQPRRRPEELTPREREILQLVWSGMTNRIIEDRLRISIKTAEAHRANMMKKLRVSNTAQLLKTALEGGLLVSSAS
jgi:DNA-binding NarL/FixJ family response regulator